jgi:hypothetical protein
MCLTNTGHKKRGNYHDITYSRHIFRFPKLFYRERFITAVLNDSRSIPNDSNASVGKVDFFRAMWIIKQSRNGRTTVQGWTVVYKISNGLSIQKPWN